MSKALCRYLFITFIEYILALLMFYKYKGDMKNTNQLSIFNTSSYLDFLKHFFEKESQERGSKARFSRLIKCSTAYLSHVLNGKAHLTPEQALLAGPALGLSDLEQRYFFNLVLRDRAGTQELVINYEKELKELSSKRSSIKERFNLQDKVSPEVESTYYSQWYYSAIRLALYIPKLRKVKAICRALNLREETVEKTISFLYENKFVQKYNGEWVPTQINLHIDENAPSIQKHHSHWRLKALQNLEQKDKSDIHYTSVVSISKKDLPKIQEIMLKTIKEVRGTVRDSQPEEMLMCYLVDCFPVTRES